MPDTVNHRNSPFLAWPGWRHLGYTILVGTLWSGLFYLVYGSASWLTDQHEFRFVCDLPYETEIPLITSMAIPYLGLFPLMMLSPFIIRERHAYWNYARILSIELFIAAMFFVFVPIRIRFPRPDPDGPFTDLYRFADTINLEHNNLPSLHVAFAVTTAMMFGSYTQNTAIRWLIVLCCLVIAASTVFTHQHHIVDAIAGYILAHLVWRHFSDSRRQPEGS